jgi:hypothetical protein
MEVNRMIYAQWRISVYWMAYDQWRIIIIVVFQKCYPGPCLRKNFSSNMAVNMTLGM